MSNRLLSKGMLNSGMLSLVFVTYLFRAVLEGDTFTIVISLLALIGSINDTLTFRKELKSLPQGGVEK